MLYADPWKLLVACILLNRTTGQQVRGVLGPLWHAYPTPQAMAEADEAELRALLRPLGLHNTRAAKLKRFCHEFITKQWQSPTELHGVGIYAADAYAIFHQGHWRDAKPADKDLRRYVQWLQDTGGEGSGLEREDLAQLLQVAQHDSGMGPAAPGSAPRPG
ncbi:hypothetical protein HYH02_013983 [Chlamydomonas schloesseri]|uniref:HhH-GPD domain-containing protein n=1 Tax=Chlamydomonas schloesseri TaxID=2026947 RepID=A0A835T1B3_9CHLO|nr:hypothetical protein HYH02_013983 [Chlamydomonas schloesseri]|eukprot:KAG2429726.1 hypothetical protein HYH02_013983 [Chlamydomonas schloesseri]